MQDGKFLTKQNTFTDFIACAEHLIKVWGLNFTLKLLYGV
jgi:protease II